MAKAGMKRPDAKEVSGNPGSSKTMPGNTSSKPVSEISGKAKKGHQKSI